MNDQPALKPGDTVAIYVNHHGQENAETVTITRETKTQLIVAGNRNASRTRRFRKSDHREIGDSGAWSPTPYLLPLDDKAVIRAQKEQANRRQFSHTINAIRAWEKERDNVETIDAAITALTNYRHHLTGATK